MSSDPSRTVQVIDSAVNSRKIALIDGRGSASVVLWPGNGARFRTMQLLKMEGGDRTIDLCHTQDSAYYIIAGSGLVRDLATGTAQDLVEGSILHIDHHDGYRFEAGPDGMHAVGGPVPADPALYDHLIEEAAQ